MTAWGHERPKGDVRVESVRLPTADIDRRGPQVAFVPPADIRCGLKYSPTDTEPLYSIFPPSWAPAINRFIAETNAEPKPFVWTARPSRILAAVKRGKETLESIH